MKTHMIISIDTGKTYDKIQHPSLIKTLRKTGIQENFLNLLIKTYTHTHTHTHTHTANNILNSKRLKWEQGKDVHSHNSYSAYFSKFSST